MEDFQGKYDGKQIESRFDKVKDMVGATASGAGAAGLVPTPAAEKRTAFLRGDGTWQDIDVHEPGFLGDNLDSEDDFRTILFNLGFDKEFTLTKAKYDIIASKCQAGIPVQYLLSGVSSSYGPGDVMLMLEMTGNIQAILRAGCSTGTGDSFVSYHVLINISSDLTHTSTVTSHTVQSVSNQTKDISLTIGGDRDEDNRVITFSTAGTGTKALMDNGTYKEIGSSGVDISSYILEGIDFKKNTTKEGFDKIKSCIINKQHMYVYYKVEMGGDVAAFTSDVITNFLYGNISLVMVDFSNVELKQVVINSSNYNITVTKI